MPALPLIALRSGLTTFLFAILVFIQDNESSNATANSFNAYIQAVSISLVSAIGLLLYVFSLRFTPVNIAVPVSSISAFWGILTAILFLQESFTLRLVLAFVILTAGLLLLDERNSEKRKYYFSTGVWLNLGAAIFWGITFALFYLPVTTLGALRFSLVLEATVFVVSLIAMLILSQWKQISFSVLGAQLKWIIILATLGVGGVFFHNLSLRFAPVAYVSLTGCIVPGISVLFSIFFLKEKITWRKVSGILILIGGIFILFIPS